MSHVVISTTGRSAASFTGQVYYDSESNRILGVYSPIGARVFSAAGECYARGLKVKK